MAGNTSTQKPAPDCLFSVSSPGGFSNGLKLTQWPDKDLPWLSFTGWNGKKREVVHGGFTADAFTLRVLKAAIEDYLASLD